MRFEGKTAIVTGGVSGIGEAIVCAFVREGASVVFLDISRQSFVGARQGVPVSGFSNRTCLLNLSL